MDSEIIEFTYKGNDYLIRYDINLDCIDTFVNGMYKGETSLTDFVNLICKL